VSWIGRPEWPRERLWFWRLGFPPVHAIATAIVPIRVEGLENLPQRGPYILVSNHISWYDPPAIEFALRIPIRFMGKRELFAVPVIGFVLRAIGSFPVRRGESDRRALEMALRVLEAGQPLGYFPEGTRSRDGVLHRAKPGIAFLARRSGAPIVPIGVSGTPEMRIRVPPRSDVVVRVGAPFTIDDLGGRLLDDQALADAIMRRVAALLPSQMRGVYAEHDRP
jgi:1-acyl-sn-glycerol-3-phosphate acyltransferase